MYLEFVIKGIEQPWEAPDEQFEKRAPALIPAGGFFKLNDLSGEIDNLLFLDAVDKPVLHIGNPLDAFITGEQSPAKPISMLTIIKITH
jgi:hypothetical protein